MFSWISSNSMCHWRGSFSIYIGIKFRGVVFYISYSKEKNRNTLLKKSCWVFYFNFLLSLSVLELLPVDPVVIRRDFAVHCPQCLAGCSEAALSLRSTQQGNRVMLGISTDSCDPALPSIQHNQEDPIVGGGSALVPQRHHLYYRMHTLIGCQQAPHAPLLLPAPSHPLLPDARFSHLPWLSGKVASPKMKLLQRHPSQDDWKQPFMGRPGTRRCRHWRPGSRKVPSKMLRVTSCFEGLIW